MEKSMLDKLNRIKELEEELKILHIDNRIFQLEQEVKNLKYKHGIGMPLGGSLGGLGILGAAAINDGNKRGLYPVDLSNNRYKGGLLLGGETNHISCCLPNCCCLNCLQVRDSMKNKF